MNLIPGITSSKKSFLLDIAASLSAFTGMSDISDIRTGEYSESGAQALLNIADMAGRKDFIITLDIKPCAVVDLTIKFRNGHNENGFEELFDRNLPDIKDIPFRHIEPEPKLTLGLLGLFKLHWNIMKSLGPINATHHVLLWRKIIRRAFQTYGETFDFYPMTIIAGLMLNGVNLMSVRSSSGLQSVFNYEEDGKPRVLTITFNLKNTEAEEKMKGDVEEIFYDLNDPSKNDLIEGRVQSILRGDTPYIAIRDIPNDDMSGLRGRVFVVEKGKA